MKISVALSAAVVASGISACKKPPPPPAQEPIAIVDAAPAVDPMTAGAEDTFAKKYSCPYDRVTVATRPDLDPMQVLASDSELRPATLPTGIKDDPGRYAKWKADEDAERERLRAMYARNTMFEVNGCGRMEIFACQPHRNGATIYPDWPDCFAARGGRETGTRREQAEVKP